MKYKITQDLFEELIKPIFFNRINSAEILLNNNSLIINIIYARLNYN